MNSLDAVRALRARPVVAIAAVLAVAALTNAVLVGCGGGGQQTTQSEPSGTPAPPAAGTTGGEPVAGPVDGAKVYADRCALCHGATGHGDGAASAALNPKPRNHTDGSYMNARTDEDLLGVIRDGKGAMPAWKDVLSEDEIKAVLSHVRSLAQPPYPG